MIVGLEEVVGAETRLDSARELDHAIPLGRDHLVQQPVDSVGSFARVALRHF